MVAIAVLLLLHTPLPEAGSLSAVMEPMQTLILPEMGAGAALMFTVAVVLQPVGNV